MRTFLLLTLSVIFLPSLGAGLAASATIDFNDLASGQFVEENRYRDLGVVVSAIGGSVQGSVVNPRGSLPAGDQPPELAGGPCDGTRSLQTEPFRGPDFTGPSFLLRFPEGVTSVELEAGDFGPSDSDEITLTAFGDDALTHVVATDTVFIAQYAPTDCARLAVEADLIRAVEVTSVSLFLISFVGLSFPLPNTIFIDNLTFVPLALDAPLGQSLTSPFTPPEETDTTFVVDAASGLDTDCIFRSGGPLVFDVAVTRVVGDVNADGTLQDAATLIANGVISSTATLTLPVFDVDSEMSDRPDLI